MITRTSRYVLLGTAFIVVAAGTARAYGLPDSDRSGHAQDLAEGLGAVASHAAAITGTSGMIDTNPHDFVDKSYFNADAHAFPHLSPTSEVLQRFDTRWTLEEV